MSVKLHSVCKIKQCVCKITQCVCKITQCVWNNTTCTKLHIFIIQLEKNPLSWKFLHWRRGQSGRLISAVGIHWPSVFIHDFMIIWNVYFYLKSWHSQGPWARKQIPFLVVQVALVFLNLTCKSSIQSTAH